MPDHTERFDGYRYTVPKSRTSNKPFILAALVHGALLAALWVASEPEPAHFVDRPAIPKRGEANDVTAVKADSSLARSDVEPEVERPEKDQAKVAALPTEIRETSKAAAQKPEVTKVKLLANSADKNNSAKPGNRDGGGLSRPRHVNAFLQEKKIVAAVATKRVATHKKQRPPAVRKPPQPPTVAKKKTPQTIVNKQEADRFRNEEMQRITVGLKKPSVQ